VCGKATQCVCPPVARHGVAAVFHNLPIVATQLRFDRFDQCKYISRNILCASSSLLSIDPGDFASVSSGSVIQTLLLPATARGELTTFRARFADRDPVSFFSICPEDVGMSSQIY